MQSLSLLHELFLRRQMPSIIHAAWQVAVLTAAGLSAQLSCLHSHVKCCGGKRFVHAPSFPQQTNCCVHNSKCSLLALQQH